jgi:hypothetical protein
MKILFLKIVFLAALFGVSIASAGQPIKRDFAANGTVTLKYANGVTLVIKPDGTEITTYPDGAGSTDQGSNAPEATPPSLPTDQLNDWAKNVSDTLMGSIESLLAENPSALARYKVFEGDASLSKQIRMRSRFLAQITRNM